jgi:hypothetical protein
LQDLIDIAEKNVAITIGILAIFVLLVAYIFYRLLCSTTPKEAVGFQH